MALICHLERSERSSCYLSKISPPCGRRNDGVVISSAARDLPVACKRFLLPAVVERTVLVISSAARDLPIACRRFLLPLVVEMTG